MGGLVVARGARGELVNNVFVKIDTLMASLAAGASRTYRRAYPTAYDLSRI